MHTIYEEALTLISQLGFERVKTLITDQTVEQHALLSKIRFDGDIEAAQDRLALLQHALVQHDATDPTFGHFVRGLHSCLKAESQYSSTVHSWRDVGTFLESYGIGWMFQNLHPQKLRFDGGRVRALTQQGRDFISKALLDAENFEGETLNVEDELESIILMEETDFSSCYKGGFTWCYAHANDWLSVIILCGDLSNGQRAYTLSHELGHVRHFTIRQDSPPWRILESSELFNEAVADAYAFRLLSGEHHRDGLTSMLEEWSLRFDDLDTVINNIESGSPLDPPGSLDELNATISPAFSVLSTITLLRQHPTAEHLSRWLESQQHPVDEIQPIIEYGSI